MQHLYRYPSMALFTLHKLCTPRAALRRVSECIFLFVIVLLFYRLPPWSATPTLLHGGNALHLERQKTVAFFSYSKHNIPIYDGAIDSGAPTVQAGSNSSPPDLTKFVNLDTERLNVGMGHPRLFALQSRWWYLLESQTMDPYITLWNNSIFALAHSLFSEVPITYRLGPSTSTDDILNVARVVQLRIKVWAYAYRLTGQSKWVERVWKEVQVASGNSSEPFGIPGDNWYSRYRLSNFLYAQFLI